MAQYLDRLNERDIATLATASGVTSDQVKDDLLLRPWATPDLFAGETVFDMVMDRQDHPAQVVSPFLLFSVLVHKAGAELRTASYVNEWAGVNTRLPVFDIEPVHDFLTDPGRLLFLADLLSNFVVPGALPVPVDDPFDLVGVAAWLDAVSGGNRAAILQWLGDVALFMSGVFPDRAGATWIAPMDAEKLGSTVGLDAGEVLGLCDSLGLSGLDAYETLGSKWYGAASESKRSPVVADVAYRFRAARRVLNHVTDRFLYELDPGWQFAA